MKELIDVRTPLAVSPNVRVEVGEDGVIHLLAGPITLHMDRGRCEELALTLARAVVGLAKLRAKQRRPNLTVVRSSAPSSAEQLPRDAEPS